MLVCLVILINYYLENNTFQKVKMQRKDTIPLKCVCMCVSLNKDRKQWGRIDFKLIHFGREIRRGEIMNFFFIHLFL